jgi:tetratricopeptide (TPR) repeat protein
VFGERFRREGVEALVGGVDLAPLLDQELVVPLGDELQVRHALVREAAYATLPDDERPRAHRLAAEWLEQSGDKDARLLAEHWERAGDKERAIPWLLAAARSAFEAGDLESTSSLAKRGIDFGATGIMRARLSLIWGRAMFFQGDLAEVLRGCLKARDEFEPGSREWWSATGAILFIANYTGDMNAATESALAVMQAPPSEPTTDFALAVTVVVAGGAMMQNQAVADAALARLPEHADADPGYRVLRSRALFWREWAFGSQLRQLLRHAREGHEGAEALGQPLLKVTTLSDLAIMSLELGDAAGAVRLFDSVRSTHSIGGRFLAVTASFLVAWAALTAGAGRTRFEEELAELRNSTNAGMIAQADALEAASCLREGNLDEAARLAQGARGSRLFAVPVLAEVEMRRGRYAEALDLVERLLPKAPVFKMARRAALLVLRAEALHGLGRLDEARVAVREARDHVLAVAETAENESQRTTYLTSVAPAVRALALAREWLVEP